MADTVERDAAGGGTTSMVMDRARLHAFMAVDADVASRVAAMRAQLGVGGDGGGGGRWSVGAADTAPTARGDRGSLALSHWEDGVDDEGGADEDEMLDVRPLTPGEREDD